MSAIKEFYHEEICKGINEMQKMENETFDAQFEEFQKNKGTSFMDERNVFMKPQMKLNMRLSVDSAQKQRYTEEEIAEEFNNDNVSIIRKLIIRKGDGAVLGEINTEKP